MTDLRALAEKDLSQTVEGEFLIPVTLVSPDGQRYAQTSGGRPLGGRVLWTRKETSAGTGEPVIVPAPVVTLRESSLKRVPKSGEVWGVLIPEDPVKGAPSKYYVTDAAGIVETGRSIGFINLPLIAAEQEADESV